MTYDELERLRREDPAIDRFLAMSERHERLFRQVNAEQDAMLPDLRADVAEAEARGDTSPRAEMLRQFLSDLEDAIGLREVVEVEHDPVQE